jgi:hypothetical protein
MVGIDVVFPSIVPRKHSQMDTVLVMVVAPNVQLKNVDVKLEEVVTALLIET